MLGQYRKQPDGNIGVSEVICIAGQLILDTLLVLGARWHPGVTCTCHASRFGPEGVTIA